MRSLEWALIQYDHYLYREKKIWTHTHTQRRECQVKTQAQREDSDVKREAETGVTLPQTKELPEV